jgi:trimeric autotransporter adhesin
MYKTRLLIGAALCAAIVTPFGVATIGAQAPAPAPAAKADKTDKKDGPLFSVTHDATLQGDGTNESPLGITSSPTVSGSLTVSGDIQADRISSRFTAITDGLTIQGPTQASTTTGNAVEARGGDSNRTPGSGFSGTGGTGLGNAFGGAGVTGIGGVSQTSLGGEGLLGIGGAGAEAGGNGVLGLGAIPGGFGLVGVGASGNERGGGGLAATGGGAALGDGGAGVDARGGAGDGAGHIGGAGITATGGIGENGAAAGLAGRFDGDVLVTGKLVKGSGSFKIDHPLDPANRYLSHSFVESPDMMNIYNGNVTTDRNGEALVELPGYFDALNRDFRYQLTVIGTFAQGIVAEKVKENHFRIKTSLPNVEVSWQVTGIRQDAYANRNRISVEEDKPERERGFYLHPDALDQSAEKSVLRVQQPR